MMKKKVVCNIKEKVRHRLTMTDTPRSSRLLATGVFETTALTFSSLLNPVSVAPREEAEDRKGNLEDRKKLFQQIVYASSNWFGSLLKECPKNFAAFSQVVRREFGGEFDAVLKECKEEMSERCQEIQIDLMKLQCNKIKSHNQQKFELRCYLEGHSQAATILRNLTPGNLSAWQRISVRSLFEDKLKMEVRKHGKMGEKTIGTATIPIVEIVNGFRDDLDLINEKGVAAGKIEMACTGIQDMAAIVKEKFRAAIVEKAKTTLQISEEDANPISEAAKAEVELAEAFVHIDQIMRKSSELLRHANVRVAFNGNPVALEMSRASCQISNFIGDSLTFEVTPAMAASPKQRKITSDITSNIYSTFPRRKVSLEQPDNPFLLSKGSACSQEFPSKIPFKSGKSISTEVKDLRVSWNLSLSQTWKASDIPLPEPKTVYATIFGLQGKNGELDSAAEILITLLFPFVASRKAWAIGKVRALMELYVQRYVNANFLVRELDLLNEELNVDISGYDEVKEVIEDCHERIASFAASGHSEESQIAFGAFRVLAQFLQDNFEETLRQKLRGKLGTMVMRCNSVKDFKLLATNHLLPSLTKIVTTFDPEIQLTFALQWSKVFADVALDVALPVLNDKLNITTNGDFEVIETDAEVTFNTYVRYQELAKHAPRHKAMLYNAFENCLESWAERSVTKAKDQVGTLLAMERSQHGQRIEDWETNGEEWLEGAQLIHGIFHSCSLVWDKIEFMDPVANLRFGFLLLEGLHKLYHDYITEFCDIILADDDFDRIELLLILNSINNSMTYLHTFLQSLQNITNDIANDEERAVGEEKTNVIARYSSMLATAQADVETRSEELIEVFCDGQKVDMRRLLDIGKSPLEHVDNLLQFLHENIDFNDDIKTERCKAHLTKSLFFVLEEELNRHLNLLEQLHPQDIEKFTTFVQILRDTRALKELLGLRDNKFITDILDRLQTKSAETTELISLHIDQLKADLDKSHKVRGEVRYKVKIESDVLTVSLWSVGNLVPREGKPDLNFSITVTVLPCKSEPYIVRHKSLIHSHVTHLIFDFEPRFKNTFEFPLAPSVFAQDDTFVQLELYDHSSVKTHKVFRGLVAFRLKDALERAEEVQSAMFKKVPMRHLEQNVILKELVSRTKTDPAAKVYVERFTSFAKEQRRPISYHYGAWAKHNPTNGDSEN